MLKAVHYKHPTIGYHSCGMGNHRTVAMTSDVDQITCKRCLGTVTGQNAAGRSSNGDRAKASLTTRIDADLKAWAIAHHLAFSNLLEEAIRNKQTQAKGDR